MSWACGSIPHTNTGCPPDLEHGGCLLPRVLIGRIDLRRMCPPLGCCHRKAPGTHRHPWILRVCVLVLRLGAARCQPWEGQQLAVGVDGSEGPSQLTPSHLGWLYLKGAAWHCTGKGPSVPQAVSAVCLGVGEWWEHLGNYHTLSPCIAASHS